jgi:hypothetical protein
MILSKVSLSKRQCLLAFSSALLLAITGCQKEKNASDSTPQIDVCALISREEVQSVQGSPVKEVKSSVNANGGFRTADCLYEGETDNQSVTVSLVQRNAGSPNARDPKEYWKISFSRYAEETNQGNREAESERAESSGEGEEDQNTVRPPKKVEGLGEASFWAWNFKGGALYVLKGNAFIRISIAGPETEESKIEKSKALAAKAMSRL